MSDQPPTPQSSTLSPMQRRVPGGQAAPPAPAWQEPWSQPASQNMTASQNSPRRSHCSTALPAQRRVPGSQARAAQAPATQAVVQASTNAQPPPPSAQASTVSRLQRRSPAAPPAGAGLAAVLASARREPRSAGGIALLEPCGAVAAHGEGRADLGRTLALGAAALAGAAEVPAEAELVADLQVVARAAALGGLAHALPAGPVDAVEPTRAVVIAAAGTAGRHAHAVDLGGACAALHCRPGVDAERMADAVGELGAGPADGARAGVRGGRGQADAVAQDGAGSALGAAARVAFERDADASFE